MLRKKFQDSKVFHYGFSMALNMAFGFIFLGYGNYTFNRQNMSIAALLISIFPQFPNSPTDNKWHLQALRHFYVADGFNAIVRRSENKLPTISECAAK